MFADAQSDGRAHVGPNVTHFPSHFRQNFSKGCDGEVASCCKRTQSAPKGLLHESKKRNACVSRMSVIINSSRGRRIECSHLIEIHQMLPRKQVSTPEVTNTIQNSGLPS